ncbi:hypothetical protein FEM48_Zijuj09G0079700 [Ziziphus jujuba var. spinosa]|uniref:RING-type domain-containing protein n=1 Tax=Ziziphus jujuba var. spinosa TaxID=714518 RepID=A0A978URS6_ZIZJJ|nr:hypothetical protein FEM48_Zijuj09G0079700 [Ziziphus jujuba var. spinosa]
MSTRGARGTTVRAYRRRKANLDFDLNREPPGDNRDQEGTSTQVGPENVQGSQQGHSIAPVTIDVDSIEAIDDDVIESSPTAFAEAKNNSRRTRGRIVVDVDSEERTRATRKRRRNNTFINCEVYINLESNSNSTRESAIAQPPPPKQPSFSCPICMGPLVEEMSTKCGHIFCKACVKAAITAQGKCPVCRKKVLMKELIRVFLPSTC